MFVILITNYTYLLNFDLLNKFSFFLKLIKHSIFIIILDIFAFRANCDIYENTTELFYISFTKY